MEVNTSIERGFLLAEDEAMKAKLSGLHVPSKGGQKRVKVWFRMPESERAIEFPFITIDLIDIEFAADRAHSAQMLNVPFWPSVAASYAEFAELMGIDWDPNEQFPNTIWWHPYNIYYQISTHTTSAQQDRVLTAKLLTTDFLPHRWGYLHVPADNTDRWLDLQGFAQADYLYGPNDSPVRVFRKIYNVMVSAHVPPTDPFLLWKVHKVAGNITAYKGSVRSLVDNPATATWVTQDPSDT